ncbi:Response regulator receiver domain-containing protein [Paenibacillus aquistagni]|uniref:Response regulator receiver domain-containing protein n=2 Tax=Paenibacillus aquistagni TaxID=1852522 RepID=A0A1X7J2L2_9BACL|nr:Response regulator receiver domain-containing protein [Paenibacillus aquistagni]
MMSVIENRAIPILSESAIIPMYNLLKANVVRSRSPFSVILITIQKSSLKNPAIDETAKEFTALLQRKLRQTDALFSLDHKNKMEWGIILAQSGEEEAGAFLQRLHEEVHLEMNQGDRTMVSYAIGVMEVRNSGVPWPLLIQAGRRALQQSSFPSAWHIDYVGVAKQQEREAVKVSIIEDDEIARDILETTIMRMKVDHVKQQVRSFQDGLDFLQSDWFYSSHPHIILLNDILPRKNGLEVLHALRAMPNNGKFFIFMMTKRNAEEDMIHAYELGVDQYIPKPFNLRLLESQMKRVFVRLWS